MENLKKMFEDSAKSRNDTLLTAVVGWHDNDDKKYGNHRKQFHPEPWADAKKKIDYEYGSGFGGANCHAVIAWGERFVYYIHEYDGATGVRFLPRNPEACAPGYGDLRDA